MLRTPESISLQRPAHSAGFLSYIVGPVLKCFQQKASRNHPKAHLSRCQNWFLVSHPSLLMSAAGKGEQPPWRSNHREGQRAEIREASPAQGASVQRETKLMAFSLQKKELHFLPASTRRHRQGNTNIACCDHIARVTCQERQRAQSHRLMQQVDEAQAQLGMPEG